MDRVLTPAAIGKNRSRVDIAAAILAVAQNGEMRTRIMEHSHLNSGRLRSYLEDLLKLGLIGMNCVNGNNIYITSEKGIQYLAQYNRITNLLK
jgi:predicted transcriptional regulator